MIDHLLLYSNRVARSNAWPYPVNHKGIRAETPGWTEEQRDIMFVRVIFQRAAYNEANEEIAAEILAPGAWAVVRTPFRDLELEAMNECVIVSDMERMEAGLSYIWKCSLQPTTPLGQIEPVWAGSVYTIPVGSPASALDEWRIL